MDDCGPTSAMSRHSTMRSPPSTRPSDSTGRRSSAFAHKTGRPRLLVLRHQDLREGSASEALLLDDLELQVVVEVGEWAAPGADRNRDGRQLVFIDQTGARQ